MVEYFRFDCSHCADFAQQTEPSIEKDYVSTGKLRLVFKPLALDGDILTASEGALCAGEQNRYWDFYGLAFANQSVGFSKGNVQQFARNLGLDTNAFNSCLDSGNTTRWSTTPTRPSERRQRNAHLLHGETSDMGKLRPLRRRDASIGRKALR